MVRSAEAVITRTSLSPMGSTDQSAASCPLKMAMQAEVEMSQARAVLSHDAEKRRPVTCAGGKASMLRGLNAALSQGLLAASCGAYRTGANTRDDVRVPLKDVRWRRRRSIPHDDVLVVGSRDERAIKTNTNSADVVRVAEERRLT
eukprot:scaffold149469_cov33-Tisochrysis_lutea.AAC.4